MKQRFYIVIESKKEIEPKDVLFALREARPGWGNMSASLAAQHSVQPTVLESPHPYVENCHCISCRKIESTLPHIR